MPRYALVTFGCQMNQHDSLRIEEVLERAGFLPADGPEDADLVLLNTCSVREKAEQKLRSEVGRLGVLKRRRKDLLIAVAGCVAQQEGERLLASMPQLDLVLGPDNIPELPGLLGALEGGSPPQVRTHFDLDEPNFLSADVGRGAQGPGAFVTVMKGCDERCSYCIVPHTRGPERYRPSGEILSEIAGLVDTGVREITLLGQTVNSYRDPSGELARAPEAGEGVRRWGRGRTAREPETEFPALLRAIARRSPVLSRLRYTSPHPRHLTPALVSAHSELAQLARHVHMPVQSGSDRVLRRMIRRYSVAEYEERLGLLREAVPGMTVSTDIIVGFPGEAEEDFLATLQLVERVGFVGVFGFKYSERPFTPAQALTDDVPEQEKARRLEALFAVSEGLRQRHLQGLVGTEQEVLAEGRGRGGGYTGRTVRNEIVHFGALEDLTGKLARVTVLGAFKHSLEGQLLDASRAAPLPSRARAPTPSPAARRALPLIA